MYIYMNVLIYTDNITVKPTLFKPMFKGELLKSSDFSF